MDSETRIFAALRGLTMVGGVAALVLIPMRPEHQLHLAPLLAGFLLYNAVFVGTLARRATRPRVALLAVLMMDLTMVFLLVWMTGGGESHFYLLFHLLVALNAYHFGPAVGVGAAALAAGLLALANWLVSPSVAWVHIGSRAALLGLLALALGIAAARERSARARADRLAQEMEVATARAEQLAAVGRLSARMAHEVRSPLGAITLNVDMLGDLAREHPGSAARTAGELLRGIQEEVRALAELTDEYLVAARLPTPRMDVDSVSDVLVDLVEFVRPVAERQGVVVDLDLEPDLPSLACDRAMLRQAVRNLIKNSLEVLPRGGQVSVSARREPGGVVIVVTDSGPGISPEAAARLFEPFFTTKTGGTGLGLSIAREIARSHGGELVWRNRPGGGAEFTIRLPLPETSCA